MFYKKFTTIAIAAVIASLLLIGVLNNSYAASITSLSVSANTDYGGGSDFSASLSADEDISYIDWYVKQTYPADEADSDYEHVHTSMHNSGTRSVSVRIGSFNGHIKIAEYDIKAEVTFEDASDSSTTTTSVYKPVYKGGYQKTGVHGYSELTAHYYDGSYIVMDGYVSAYNGTGENARGFGRFRHTAINKNLDELEEPLPNEIFEQGETYSYSTSHWGTYFNYFCGELQDVDGGEWVCNAYLRLKVHQGKTDDWLAEDTNTFTYLD